MLHGSTVWGVSVMKRRGGVPIDKTSLKPYLVVSVPSAGVSNVCEATNILLLVQNEECVHKMRCFNREPLLPSVDLGGHNVIHVIKWTRPSLSVFAYRSKTQ